MVSRIRSRNKKKNYTHLVLNFLIALNETKRKIDFSIRFSTVFKECLWFCHKQLHFIKYSNIQIFISEKGTHDLGNGHISPTHSKNPFLHPNWLYRLHYYVWLLYNGDWNKNAVTRPKPRKKLIEIWIAVIHHNLLLFTSMMATKNEWK